MHHGKGAGGTTSEAQKALVANQVCDSQSGETLQYTEVEF